MKTKPGRGKQKGAQFEREVCKMLSLAMSDGTRDDLYWRSAMSGGRATIGFGRKNQLGDISAIGSEGCALTDQFVIECKRYHDIGLTRFLISGSGSLSKFWGGLCILADKNNRHPLLVFQEDRGPLLGLVTAEEELYALIGDCYSKYVRHCGETPYTLIGFRCPVRVQS